jgi:hypothetical protein
MKNIPNQTGRDRLVAVAGFGFRNPPVGRAEPEKRSLLITIASEISSDAAIPFLALRDASLCPASVSFLSLSE